MIHSSPDLAQETNSCCNVLAISGERRSCIVRHAGSRGVSPAALQTGRAAAAVEDHGRGLLGARGGFGILLLLLRLHEQHTLTLHKHTRISTPRGGLNSGSPSTGLISAPFTPTDGPHEEDQTAAVPDAEGG